MAGAFGFEDVLLTCIYFLAVWLGGKAVAAIPIGVPPLVGEILVGTILGPKMLDIVPFYPAVMLVGELGLLLLVVEAGLEVDIEMLKEVGVLGVMVGFAGSAVPLAIGFGICNALGFSTGAAFAAGAAFAPTSMGIAINVLKSANVLSTPTGQLVITAAVVDDVIALVLLSELRALKDPSALNFSLPVVSAVVFLVGFGAFAVLAMPKLVHLILPKIKESRRGKALLLAMFTLALALMAAANYSKASYLLGCFLAGLCFCTIHEIDAEWVRQIKRVSQLLLHVFFSATIGFEIPIKDFFNVEVLKYTAAFLVPLLGKLLTGVFARPRTVYGFFTIGFAMAAWGEFAFLIANETYRDGVLNDIQFTAISAAILISAIISPIMLNVTLKLQERQTRKELHGALAAAAAGAAVDEVSAEAGTGTYTPVYYKLLLKGRAEWSLMSALFDAAARLDLHVVEARVNHAKNRLAVRVFYLLDTKLSLPFTIPAESEEAGELFARLQEIHTTFLQCANGTDGTDDLWVVRWLPARDHTEISSLHTQREMDDALLNEIRADSQFTVTNMLQEAEREVGARGRPSVMHQTTQSFLTEESQRKHRPEMTHLIEGFRSVHGKTVHLRRPETRAEEAVLTRLMHEAKKTALNDRRQWLREGGFIRGSVDGPHSDSPRVTIVEDGDGAVRETGSKVCFADEPVDIELAGKQEL